MREAVRRDDVLLIWDLLQLAHVLFLGAEARHYGFIVGHFLTSVSTGTPLAMKKITNLTVNTTGPGRGVATDLQMEHIIGVIKSAV
jgi:hypothetical protein